MEKINRYTIKHGAMNEYILKDNATGEIVINTIGLCADEEGAIIAKTTLEYALSLLDDTNRPSKSLNLTSYIVGTGEQAGLDEEGNELILTKDNELKTVNGENPTAEEAEYYKRHYGLKCRNISESVIMTDKLFDYLEKTERDIYYLCVDEKEELEKHTRNHDWDKVIMSAVKLRTYHAELNTISSMIEAHECEDI